MHHSHYDTPKVEMDESDWKLAQEILSEFKAVSEMSCQSRFNLDVDTLPLPKEFGPDQSFIDCTPENPTLNQYWYSKETIDILCNAIVEKISSFAGKVAFLSTPSLYFAMPPVFKDRCFVLDVSPTFDSYSIFLSNSFQIIF
jgi:hypothetical protein